MTLEAHNAKPGEETPNELAHRKAKLAALVKRIEAAEEESLGTPLSPKKDRQKAIIAKWEEEQAELERQIQNLTITEGDVTKFAKWWEEMRKNLVNVLPASFDDEDENREAARRALLIIQPTEEGIRQFAEAAGDTPVEVAKTFYRLHEAIPELRTFGNPAIKMEASRFRNLLKNLGFKVVLFWKPQIVTDRKGETHESSRFHELDRAELTINGKNSVEGFNVISIHGVLKQESSFD